MAPADRLTTGVRIVEVGPRDGLQNISNTVPTSTKVDLITRLSKTGLRTIELTSNVSPKAIPQLADNRALLSDGYVQRLLQEDGFRLPVLVPNLKGLRVALDHKVREIAVFISATEGFSKANINCTVEEGIRRSKEVTSAALKAGLAVRGYISCIFADPFDGPTKPEAVLRCVQELLSAGCYEVSLGDTLGVGTAANVLQLVQHLVDNNVPVEKLAGHFHDTYGQAVSNVWAAYTAGLRVFDSSVGGLGGCPFAPGAKGNVSTEDVVYMFHQAGVSTQVNLENLAEVGNWICKSIGVANSSRAGPAIIAKHAAKTKSSSIQKKKTQSPTINWNLESANEDDELLVHRSNADIKVVLNRPRNGNALTTNMITALSKFFEQAKSDNSISRIAIAGSGRFFCTGMDLGKNSSPVGHQKDTERDAQYNRLTRLFDLIDHAPQVTIACINGPVFAGGVGLAFSCDIRLAVSNATFTLTEVKLGLAPATISKYVVREWGLAFTRQAMLTALPVTVQSLLAQGSVAAIGEDHVRLLDAYITHLRKCAPGASSKTKELVRLGYEHAGKEEQEQGIKSLFNEMMRPEEEGAYGVAAFQRGIREVDWTKFQKEKSKL